MACVFDDNVGWYLRRSWPGDVTRVIVNLQAVLTTTRRNKLQAYVCTYNADTISVISSVLSKEVSPLWRLKLLPVGVAMHTCAVERYADAFQSSPLLYARKKNQPEASIMCTSAITV